MFSTKMIEITKLTKCMWKNTSNTLRLSENVMRFSTSHVNKGMSIKPVLILIVGESLFY